MHLRQITNPEEFLKYYRWIRDIDFIDMTATDCLARCLTGQYEGYLGIKEGTAVAIVIYEVIEDRVLTIGLWAKNNLRGLPALYYARLKARGFKSVRSISDHPEEAYSRLIGMDKIFSVFERKL